MRVFNCCSCPYLSMVLRGQVVTFGAPLVFVKAAAERDPGAARAL